MNDQLCNSDDVTVIFTADDDQEEPLFMTNNNEQPLPSLISPTFSKNNSTKPMSNNYIHSISVDIWNSTIIEDLKKPQKINTYSIKISSSLMIFLLIAGFLLMTIIASIMVIFIWKKCYRDDKSKIEKSAIIPWAMANSR